MTRSLRKKSLPSSTISDRPEICLSTDLPDSSGSDYDTDFVFDGSDGDFDASPPSDTSDGDGESQIERGNFQLASFIIPDEDQDHPPDYYINQIDLLDDTEFTGEDYADGNANLLDRLERQWGRYIGCKVRFK